MSINKIRPIAIYLPQFHPISENDKWWGKGFTEWTNVTKATPKFKGHYQPHLPADLGFYDLRLKEARLAQEQMARKYGIYGFCYYHYWFNGRQILEKPLNEKIKNPQEDLPFMVCWANENWSRRWDGSENELLLEQHYTMEDHRTHIKSLFPLFKDERYIKIHNKAVFAIYRTTEIPNFEDVIKLWREEAAKEDISLYIIRFEGMSDYGEENMIRGIDAAAEFQPMYSIGRQNEILRKKKTGLKDGISITNGINSFKAKYDDFKRKYFNPSKRNVLEYETLVKQDIDFNIHSSSVYKLFSAASPGWDNSARKAKSYLVLKDSTPKLFRKWVEYKLKKFRPYSDEENLFFINAWNEWAEGNHLEPDRKWGMKYLEELKMALTKNETEV